ncbi:MAG: hypothetical protein AAF429_12560 [Pseudomonadota bacterium]
MVRIVVISAIWIAMITTSVLIILSYFSNWASLGDVVSAILCFALAGFLAAAATRIADRRLFNKSND